MTLLFSTISAVAQFKFNTNKNQEIIANTYGKDLANVSHFIFLLLVISI
jgi:hypothetical protein